MRLGTIRPAAGATKDTKRLGKGAASGQGGTAGKGHKGKKARAGGKIPAWFEGGQMPLNRRLPKRGFTNIFKKSFQLVNLDALDAHFESGAKVDAEALALAGLVKYVDRPIKLLARGKVEKALHLEVAKASEAAIAAVQAVGGSVAVKA